MKINMNRKALSLMAAAALSIGALTAVPAGNTAQAESFGFSIRIGDAPSGYYGNYRHAHRYNNRRVSPRYVRRSLRHRYGFNRIRNIRYRPRGRHGVYVARAWRHGHVYRVVVNARNGRLLRTRHVR